MSQTKSSLIVVFGATGKQGGSVVARLLEINKKSPTGDLHSIRAITRNPSSAKGKALSQQGVEVVAADLDNYESVLRAFKNAEYAFGTTDFWAPFGTTSDSATSSAIEVRQGKHLADAAAATPTLKHYVWSSLPCLDHSVPHMESKVIIDDYISTSHPQLARKTTFLLLGYYASNIKDYDPPSKAHDGSGYVWRQPAKPSSRIYMLGKAEVNTGIFVEAILRNRALCVGKYVQGASDILSFSELMELWSRVVGVPARAEEVTMAEYRKTAALGDAFGLEMGLNMVYFGQWDEGLMSWTKPGFERVSKEDLGIQDSDLVNTEATFREIDWSAFKA